MNKPKEIGERLSEEEYNAISDRWYELGKVSATEEIGPIFKARSGEFYANDQLEKASLLKELAREWTERGKTMRKEYHGKYPNK